jgi:hypothetical protein
MRTTLLVEQWCWIDSERYTVKNIVNIVMGSLWMRSITITKIVRPSDLCGLGYDMDVTRSIKCYLVIE